MKQIKQSRLYFQDDRSDKVYEVDLCEVEQGLFVVNFRYGRRGANLKEGTKTVFPVELGEAEKIFEKLVESKTKKGYQEGEVSVGSVSAEKEESIDFEKRNEQIGQYLKLARQGKLERDWPVSRIIWRAGELKLADYAEDITPYLVSADEMESYSAIWALGKMEYTPACEMAFSVFKTCFNRDKKYRILAAYLLRSGNTEMRNKVIESLFTSFNLAPQEAIKAGNTEAFSLLFSERILQTDVELPYFLTNLYLCSGEFLFLRDILLRFLQSAPLKPGFFKAFRYIFKLAEWGDDYAFYSLISKRFAVTQANFSSPYGDYWSANGYVEVAKEAAKADSTLAFSSETRKYMNRRVVRSVKKAADQGAEAYLNLTTSMLLSLDEEADKASARREKRMEYDYENWRYNEIGVTWYPAYSQYGAVMTILYGNSERYSTTVGGNWYASFDDIYATLEDNGREELHPYFWNTAKTQILDLLIHARSSQVVRFACRVAEDNPAIGQDVSDEHLLMMLQSKYQQVNSLTIAWFQAKYKDQLPGISLIVGLIGTGIEAGKQVALEYLDKDRANYWGGNQLMLSLLVSGKEVCALFLKEELERGIPELIGYNKIKLEEVKSWFASGGSIEDSFFQQVFYLIESTPLRELFSDFSADDIGRFISSQRTDLVFGGLKLIQVNRHSSYDLSKGFIGTLIEGEEPLVREAAVRLLSDYPISYWDQKEDVIKKLIFSKHAEIRGAIGPLISRLIELGSSWGNRLLTPLLISLCAKEENEGMHMDVVELIDKHFSSLYKQVHREALWQLLFAGTDAAQWVAEKIFIQQYDSLDKLKSSEVLELASCDILSVRKAVQHQFEKDPAKIDYYLEEYLNVINASWADSRAWACSFLMNKIKEESWTLEYLMFVCDCPYHDVQAFGRSLTSKVFSSEIGLELLLKLSEHPTDEMKLFTTNYLAGFAADKPEVIAQLKFYFESILLSVNRNAVAKKRVIAFLEAEAMKDHSVAVMVTELLNRLISTGIKSDKSAYISLLLSIQEQYEDLRAPFTIVEPQVYTNAV